MAHKLAILVVTIGNLAQELLYQAQLLVGRLEGVEAFCIKDIDFDRAVEELKESIVNLRDGLLVLTDCIGTEATQAVIKVLKDIDIEDIEVVVGVNLCMLLNAIMHQQDSLSECVAWVEKAGKRNIIRLTRYLRCE